MESERATLPVLGNQMPAPYRKANSLVMEQLLEAQGTALKPRPSMENDMNLLQSLYFPKSTSLSDVK
jgi:hypothetical protein